ncbi:MAG: hypothetical protein WC376_03550 [Candidatus Nanoarchaeia archaeon]|jgi:hypothetical protein
MTNNINYKPSFSDKLYYKLSGKGAKIIYALGILSGIVTSFYDPIIGIGLTAANISLLGKNEFRKKGESLEDFISRTK